MTKLKFDYELMRNHVIPQLNNVKGTLDEISTKFSYMTIPNFSKTTYINDTKSDIKTKSGNINSIINWICDSNKLLDDIIDNYEKSAKFLPLYLMGKRDSAIKEE
ncbi:MAG: hypothetical protein E7170_04880 [Firmicutes bacterium]|nr:hypothetical protein [Bacillota bacterium]